MKNKIKQLCKNLEKEYNIKILFAVENGSRAWRISSKDSDYDVRFVYYRKVSDYLTLNKKADVVHIVFDKNLKRVNPEGALIDVQGFDIFKYCILLSSSNPTTIEWLMTDIVYYGKQNKVFKEFVEKYFNPTSLYYHYKSMCKNNYLKYLVTNNDVTYKRYLYCLRGMINAEFVRVYNKIPPINFIDTYNRINLNLNLLNTIKRIIELKKEGKEINIVDRIMDIDLEIQRFINEIPKDLPINKKSIDILDKEIKKILKVI